MPYMRSRKLSLNPLNFGAVVRQLTQEKVWDYYLSIP